jgi:MYXO-CTERM domain-containing protein
MLEVLAAVSKPVALAPPAAVAESGPDWSLLALALAVLVGLFLLRRLLNLVLKLVVLVVAAALLLAALFGGQIGLWDAAEAVAEAPVSNRPQ